MASSSRTTLPRSTSPTSRHSRVIDAVQVAPYLTHVVRHHGQVTLIPPENAGRIRKVKKKRPAIRVGDSSSSFELPRTHSRPVTPRPASSASTRNLQSEVNGIRRPVHTRSRSVQSRELYIPDFPPPSFEEAMLALPSTGNSTPGLFTGSAPSTECLQSPERCQSDDQTSSPHTPINPSASPSPSSPSPPPPLLPDDDVGSLSQNSSHSSFEVTLEGGQISHWEDDRAAGFALEERVRRELERRLLADSLPRAPSMRIIEQENGCARKSFDEAGPSFTNTDDTVSVTKQKSCARLKAQTSRKAVVATTSVSGSQEHEMHDSSRNSFPLSGCQDTRNENDGTAQSEQEETDMPSFSTKGKGKEHGSTEPALGDIDHVSAPGPSSTMSRIHDVLNTPIRPQVDVPYANASPAPTLVSVSLRLQSSEPCSSFEQRPEPLAFPNDSSASHSVSATTDNIICIDTMDSVTPSQHFPPDSISSDVTSSISPSNSRPSPPLRSTRPLPTPLNLPPLASRPPPGRPLPDLRAVPPPIPPPSGVSVRDRISAFESLRNRPIPPPPPLRPVTRRPPPPVPGRSTAVRVSALDSTYNTTRGSSRRTPPPIPARPTKSSCSSASDVLISMSVTAGKPSLTSAAPSLPSSSSIHTERDLLMPQPTEGRDGSVLSEGHGQSEEACRRSETGSSTSHAFTHEESTSARLRLPAMSTETLQTTFQTGADGVEESSVNVLHVNEGVEHTSQTIALTDGSRMLSSTTSHASSPSQTQTITRQDTSGVMESTYDGSNSTEQNEHSSLLAFVDQPDGLVNTGSTFVNPESSTASYAERTQDTMPPAALPLQPMFTGLTDLDLLLARLEDPDFTFSGQSYDDLLLLEEIMGPAMGTPSQPRAKIEDIPLGKVEMLRRRVTKDGRTKLKLALLGVVVDKCGICFVQFKEGIFAGLLPCRHAFHDNCLKLWMRRGETCPLCRGPLCSS